MTTPTLATRLPGPAEIRAAARDYEIFHALRNTLPEHARAQFDQAVDREYDDANGLPPARALTEVENSILEFAAHLPEYKTPGELEETVRTAFKCSATRYFQALNVLIDRVEAAEQHPVTVYRLRRQRAARQAARRGRTDTPRSAAA